MGPLKSLWSQKVIIHCRIIQIYKICGINKEHFAPFPRFHWNHYIWFLIFLTVSKIVTSTQKTGEPSENIRFSLVQCGSTKTSLTVHTVSKPFFCLLHVHPFFVVYPLESQMRLAVFEVSLHFGQSWPTVCHVHMEDIKTIVFLDENEPFAKYAGWNSKIIILLISGCWRWYTYLATYYSGAKSQPFWLTAQSSTRVITIMIIMKLKCFSNLSPSKYTHRWVWFALNLFYELAFEQTCPVVLSPE